VTPEESPLLGRKIVTLDPLFREQQ
jgi:hypothetical protein